VLEAVSSVALLIRPQPARQAENRGKEGEPECAFRLVKPTHTRKSQNLKDLHPNVLPFSVVENGIQAAVSR